MMQHLSVVRTYTPAEIVSQIISDKLYPFRPGIVEVWVHEGTTFIVKVTASTFVDDIFKMDGRSLYALPREEDMAVWVGTHAARYFSSLIDAVPDNIDLGTN